MMNIDTPARTIWDYMLINEPIKNADAIFVLCSLDTRVAERAAELYQQGFAPWVIVSGDAGELTKDRFNKPEAEVFADILQDRGVPREKIIVENRSKNTGENIKFTYDLLKKLKYTFTSLILVQKPYMERRTYATFKKQWPDKETKIIVTSPQIPYDDYFTNDMPKDLVINVMVGDLQRIKEYPAKGFQVAQNIPDDVWKAYEQLVEAGFTKHLIAGSL